MMSHSRSKVYLVGAGPGDPGLLTLKAREILQDADVVIYDFLANPLLLRHAPRAELIDAGKRHGQRTISQRHINELIVQKALENKIVVRLKGGDPFIFGRGGEELASVVEANLPFEVIPGVSSAVAVPAYAGIPLTHRDISSNVVFLTGTEHPDKPQTMIPWEAIAQIGTIVVMMGLTVLRNVMERLIAAGRDPQTSGSRQSNGEPGRINVRCRELCKRLSKKSTIDNSRLRCSLSLVRSASFTSASIGLKNNRFLANASSSRGQRRGLFLSPKSWSRQELE